MDDELRDIESAPVELAPLAAGCDAARFEALVAGILAAAGPELERRATAASPIAWLAGRLRPALAAAATVAVVAVASMIGSGPRGDGVARAPEEDLGMPAPLPEWLAQETAPTVMEVMVALDGDQR